MMLSSSMINTTMLLYIGALILLLYIPPSYGIGYVIRMRLIRNGITTITDNLRDNTIIRIPRVIQQPNFGIEAIAVGNPIPSVQFQYNNDVFYHTESMAPYSMCSNTGNEINPCPVLRIGSHRVSATVPGSARIYTVRFQIVHYDGTTISVITAPPTAPIIPMKAPVKVPTNKLPSPTIKVPVKAPIKKVPPPTMKVPVKAPIKKQLPPTPRKTQVVPITPAQAPTTAPNFPILINCGGPRYTDGEGRVWMADTYFNGGGTYATSAIPITNTFYDPLYFSERNGNFVYNIPLPTASYSVSLHFAEIVFNTTGQRVFDVLVEGDLISNIDIVSRAGSANRALIIDKPVIVTDGSLRIDFLDNQPRIGGPALAAIEIRVIGPHYAHAISGGPYTVVDTDGDGSAIVRVDGRESHTHGPGLSLVSFVWKRGPTIIGTGESTTFSLPIGLHTITLTVTDSSGDANTETTTVRIRPNTFPDLTSITPTGGDVAGGTVVTIIGSAFRAVRSVKFGTTTLSGAAITVVNENTIRVQSPPSAQSVPVPISVVTAIGESKSLLFQYRSVIPVRFTETKLIDFDEPTAVAFGPDSKLYVGTSDGKLAKFTMNDNFDTVLSSVISTVERYRGIYGIAFDPLDNANTNNPTVYVTTSDIYHDEGRNSIGDAVNGKVVAVSGANLDIVTEIVTGLPVSAADHSVNSLAFGNNGELFITVGSNTNGGIPGELSREKLMSENYFSGAVLIANLGRPNFNGFIKYSAPNDGDPISGFGPNGVQVFASGLRNSFGIAMHSNGKLYATDNGPNPGFGDMATGCGPGEYIPDEYGDDELNFIVRNGYYGHPNHKRARRDNDPRQCKWIDGEIPSTATYTAPLMSLDSSTNSVIEYDANYFNGEMRNNLIVSKYEDELYRIILSADGNSVLASSKPAILLGGNNGLAVTMAPNGNIIDARYPDSSLFVYKPVEPPTAALMIYSVFPRRGGLAGGTTITIYGANFNANTKVFVRGTYVCSNPTVRAGNTIITCTLPAAPTLGLQNISVENIPRNRKTLLRAYRYVKGAP